MIDFRDITSHHVFETAQTSGAVIGGATHTHSVTSAVRGLRTARDPRHIYLSISHLSSHMHVAGERTEVVTCVC